MNRRQFSLKFLFAVTALVAVAFAFPSIAVAELGLLAILVFLMIPALVILAFVFGLSAVGMKINRGFAKILGGDEKVSAGKTSGESSTADGTADGRNR